MFAIYRVYFRGLALDSDLFPSTPPRVVDVPDKKPADFSGAVTVTLFKMTLAPGEKGENNAEVACTPGNKDKNNAQVSIEQRKMLKELKHNIESFLNSFKGVIPDKELNQRKRVLFMQLRLGKLNGGANNKKQKQEEEKEAKFAGVESGAETEPPTTDDDWENVEGVGAIDSKKQQQQKARRAARREARRGRGGMKQQKEAEEKVVKPETMDENRG